MTGVFVLIGLILAFGAIAIGCARAASRLEDRRDR